MSDLERQKRIAALKLWEKQGHSFIEIVNNYNATFGTNHFAEVLGNPALPASSGKRTAKEFAQDIHDVFLGETGLGF